MPNLREAVQEEMARRGWTTYKLVQELKGKRKDRDDVPSVTVYEYLRGDTEINSGDLGLICDVLGLTLKRRR